MSARPSIATVPRFARMAHADVERHNLAALHFGKPYGVLVGQRRYALQFEPCRARYPLRLHGEAGGEPLLLDCDAAALFPELGQEALAQLDASAAARIAEALDDWLCALEGLFGFTIALTAVSFDEDAQAGAYGLALTHLQSGRAAHFSFRNQAVDHWLASRTPAAGRATAANAFAGRLALKVPVCLSGPALTLPRVRQISAGDVVVVNGASCHLRVPLRDGARRLLLKSNEDTYMIDRILPDEAPPVEETSELVPVDALTFPFDAVLGTVPMSVHDLLRLRAGSVVPFQMPLGERSVTLLCQGVPFARGELVEIEDTLGVRIMRLTHGGAGQ